MRVKAALAAIACLALAAPAAAGLTSFELGSADVAPAPGARLPLSTPARDESGQTRTLGEALDGRPALLILADYTCRTLCGPILAVAASALAQTGLRPGADYRLIVIGLDPKDTAADARAMKQNQIADAALAAQSALLHVDDDTIQSVTRALGYRYAYDSVNDQFAHPAAVFVLTADGVVARALSALGLDAADLRLALVEAGEGKLGTWADHIRLLCYGFDPAAGVYTFTIQRWLMILSAFTIAGLGGGIGFMLLGWWPAAGARRRRNAPAGPV